MEILKKWSALAVLAAALLATLAGCQTTRRVLNTETSAELQFTIAKDVNPDSDNRPSPIVISVYVLKDARQFEREDFLSLYEAAAQRLGPDLVRKIRLREFVPGETRTENIPLDPSVHYLGVVAEYSQYNKAQTIVVLPITDHTNNEFHLRAEHLRLVNADSD